MAEPDPNPSPADRRTHAVSQRSVLHLSPSPRDLSPAFSSFSFHPVSPGLGGPWGGVRPPSCPLPAHPESCHRGPSPKSSSLPRLGGLSDTWCLSGAPSEGMICFPPLPQPGRSAGCPPNMLCVCHPPPSHPPPLPLDSAVTFHASWSPGIGTLVVRDRPARL